MSDVRTADPVIDYLDRPPQRWRHEFQKASGSREMVEDSDGEWVKFDDMDLYMFEGGQLMLRLVSSQEALLQAAKTWLRLHEQSMVSREAATEMWASGQIPRAMDALRAAISKWESRS